MPRDIVTDGPLNAIVQGLNELANEDGAVAEKGRIIRSLVGVKTMLDQVLVLRARVQAMVSAANPSVTAADVTAVTNLHARMVQTVKDWANAL